MLQLDTCGGVLAPFEGEGDRGDEVGCKLRERRGVRPLATHSLEEAFDCVRRC